MKRQSHFLSRFSRRLTLMLVPHSGVRSLRVSISIPFLFVMIASWTGLTLWAGYVASRQIDYYKIQTEHHLLKLKVAFFAREVKQSRAMIEQVRDNDQQLRTLLGLKSKTAIIETEGRGGPTAGDSRDLELLLSGKIYEMNQQDIKRQVGALQAEARTALASIHETNSQVALERALFRARPNRWPCYGSVTSRFGERINPFGSAPEFHAGLDIANACGTPVYCTADGLITLADWQPGYGKIIVIDHGFGLRTYYAHLHSFDVERGQRVARGQMVGRMGSTGSSTGNHLHYEVSCDGRPVNPASFLTRSRERRT